MGKNKRESPNERETIIHTMRRRSILWGKEKKKKKVKKKRE